uniref:PDZ domain-containing protein n=1 Tax=Triticum aestivum TaxID=4565 RepID=A0A080YUG8_WHEAT|nr:unnamed protein product [Triticum aestivum]
MPSTESLESRATRPLRHGSTAATPGPGLGVTTRSRARAQQESQSQYAARAKLREADGCKKRAKLDGTSQPESSKKGKPSSTTAKIVKVRVGGTRMMMALPLRSALQFACPCLKITCLQTATMELPTLFEDMPPSCLVDDPTLLHIREPARKTVLRAAQFVVGVSSSIDGEPLARCSGFWIDFDNENKTGTVVTTALVIRTRHTSKGAWHCKDQYACDAKVYVDLRGYKGYIMAEGRLLYYQKHYNLAFFRVRVDSSVQLPSFSDKVKSAQDIFELGRDDCFNLLINHGRVEYSNPSRDERYHHMYIQGPQRDCMHDLGGPVIDLDGKVVGMIGSCSGGHIPRPHLRLKFNAISLLNPAHVEHILVECEIDEGLIVTEVCEDSPAEKCGIRNGDVIECLNGKRVSTTVELENMLLSIMENIGDNINSDLDLEIQVYFTRTELRRIKVLTVNVSEDGEYCEPYYATRMHFVSAKSYLKMTYILPAGNLTQHFTK